MAGDYPTAFTKKNARALMLRRCSCFCQRGLALLDGVDHPIVLEEDDKPVVFPA